MHATVLFFFECLWEKNLSKASVNKWILLNTTRIVYSDVSTTLKICRGIGQPMQIFLCVSRYRNNSFIINPWLLVQPFNIVKQEFSANFGHSHILSTRAQHLTIVQLTTTVTYNSELIIFPDWLLTIPGVMYIFNRTIPMSLFKLSTNRTTLVTKQMNKDVISFTLGQWQIWIRLVTGTIRTYFWISGRIGKRIIFQEGIDLVLS